MRRWGELLASLPAETDRLLEALLVAAGDEPIIVTLHLHGGRDLTGALLGRKEDPRHPAWALELAGHERYPDDLTLVPCRLVEAVTLRSATRIEQALEARRPPPTRLELQRLAKALSERLRPLLGHELTISGLDASAIEPRAAQQLLRRLENVLSEIAAQPIGVEALQPISVLELGPGSPTAVTRAGATLRLVCDLGAVERVAEEAELKTLLEAQL